MVEVPRHNPDRRMGRCMGKEATFYSGRTCLHRAKWMAIDSEEKPPFKLRFAFRICGMLDHDLDLYRKVLEAVEDF